MVPRRSEWPISLAHEKTSICIATDVPLMSLGKCRTTQFDARATCEFPQKLHMQQLPGSRLASTVVRPSSISAVASRPMWRRVGATLAVSTAVFGMNPTQSWARDTDAIVVERNVFGDPVFTRGGSPVANDEAREFLTPNESAELGRLQGASLVLATTAGVGIGFAVAEMAPIGGGEGFLRLRGPEIWTLLGASFGLLTVAIPFGARANDILVRGVERHNAGGATPRGADGALWPRTWFLRAGFNAGVFTLEETIEGTSAEPLTLKGPGAAYDWMLGHSVYPGLVLGAGIMFVGQYPSSVSSGGRTLDAEGLSVNLTAPFGFAQYYPLPGAGLNAQLLGGYAAEVADRDTEQVQSGARGPLAGLGVGWDFELGPGAAIGVFARGLYGALSTEVDVRTSGPGSGVMDTVTRPLEHSWVGATVGLDVTYY